MVSEDPLETHFGCEITAWKYRPPKNGDPLGCDCGKDSFAVLQLGFEVREMCLDCWNSLRTAIGKIEVPK